MTRSVHAPCRWGACWALVVWTAVGPVHAASPAKAKPEDPDAAIAALRRRVLADPIDAQAVPELDQQRRKQVVERNNALDALAQGLGVYLDGRMREAGVLLGKAARCKSVVAWAKAVTPLDMVFAACGVGPRRPKAAHRLCRECGGTLAADCPMCKGAGWRRCTRCNGTGTYRVQRSRRSRSFRMQTCNTCEGKGIVVCGNCKGAGTTPCNACDAAPDARAHADAAPAAGPPGTRAIRVLILKARYRRNGGLLFDDPATLRPSPRPGREQPPPPRTPRPPANR